jgi:hypothetical protein
MSAAAAVNITSLLTSLGLGSACPDRASEDVELVVETFDSWQNSAISLDGPVMGCVCFRDSEWNAIAA